MISHIKILKKLKLDSRIIQLFKKEIIPPHFFDNSYPVADLFYTFPPFFIPLFVDDGDPSYLGLVYHPFSNREMVFVKYDLSAGYMWEIARTPDQFLLDILIQCIDANEDIIDKDIKKFADEIKIKIDDDFKNTYQNLYDGDSFETYRLFDLFSSNTPSVYIGEASSYNGDYPTIRGEINIKTIYSASEFEIDEEIKNITSVVDLPIWLQNKNLDKSKILKEFLDQNKLKEAWLILNSKGWRIKDAIQSLEILKTKTDDELFHLVSDNWIEGFKNSNAKDNDMY